MDEFMAMQKRCRLEGQCNRNRARHDFMDRMEKEAEIKEEQEKAEHSRRDRLVISLEIQTDSLLNVLALAVKANEELKKECKRLTRLCDEQILEITEYRRARRMPRHENRDT